MVGLLVCGLVLLFRLLLLIAFNSVVHSRGIILLFWCCFCFGYCFMFWFTVVYLLLGCGGVVGGCCSVGWLLGIWFVDFAVVCFLLLGGFYCG